MRYILMMNTTFGAGDYQHGEWAPEDWQAHLAYWGTLNKGLEASGEFVTVQALTAPVAAQIVRARPDGTPAVTDGPFPESKEFLAGYWIVEVDRPERAYEIAAAASAAPGPGGAPLRMPIEVREIPRGPAPAT